ncbi:MAG: Wadjet anti-phage system protein JetD domain-containing protein [Acidiferrobacter sp.]
MSWTTPDDVRAHVMRRWTHGDLLSPLVTGRSEFPIRVPCRTPSAREMTERFADVRAWAADLRALPHTRLTVRAVRHRTLGANELPSEIWIDTLDDALALAHKTTEARCFERLLTLTAQARPELLGWLADHPLRALELAGAWEHLLAVVTWIADHPRPNVYLRQVDLSGIDSKFIEAHRGPLGALLDAVLPKDAYDPTTSVAAGFATRYGFREKPLRVRLRPLDDALPLARIGTDITLDAPSLSALDPEARHVIITENEVNFLTLPTIPRAIALFGAGYGFAMLQGLPWLMQTRIHYWGDIDTHGFAILDQLRIYCPHAHSLLMDHETLFAHESHWGREDKQTARDLPRLTHDERQLYDELRDNRIRPQLRLEQERIGFRWVEQAIARLSSL